MSDIHSLSDEQLFLYLVLRLAAKELDVHVGCGVNRYGSKVHVAMSQGKRCKTAIWHMAHLTAKLSTEPSEAFAVALIATKIKMKQLQREFNNDFSD